MMEVTEANPQTLKYCFSFCDLYIYLNKMLGCVYTTDVY